MKYIDSSDGVDKTDVRILEILIQNYDNKHMSSKLRIPLSTIQRRARKLVDKGFTISESRIDFTKFGFKSGSIHIYLSDGNIEFILDQISKLKGVTSLEVHIGNSDIIAGIVYRNGRELLKTISAIKGMEDVDRIVWSERIYDYPIPSNKASILELAK